MRVPLLAVALAVLLLLFPAAQGAENVRDPGKVNKILDILESPQLAPGEGGDFLYVFRNPYANPMRNAMFTAEIYFYATIDVAQPVDRNWTAPFPRIANGTDATKRQLTMVLGDVPQPPGNFTSRIAIETSTDMPHGTVFSQAAYFVRFGLTFDYNNGTGDRRYTMASKGYFPTSLWEQATNGTCTSGLCYGSIDLGLLGVYGILPDSLFGVKEPITFWPFWVLAGIMVVFLVMAFLYWVEDNPASFPRVDRAWAVARGKLRQLVAFYGPHRRRPP